MKLIVLLCIVTFLVSVKSESANQSSLYSFLGSLTSGFSNLSSMMSNFKELFQLIFKDNSEIPRDLTIEIPEDAYLNITELARKYGYPIEEHTVVTEDGYILNFYRIPHGINGTTNGRIAFLMHGIMDSSDSWVLQGPNYALAYILADQGYDVWLGNARGNKYALEHVNFTSTDPDFWKFTWEEIGVYDLPSMIDYALNVSGKVSLYYIGHSQGTTTFYVMGSMKPEYNNKVKLMFSLSPVAWLGHSSSILVKIFSPAHNILGNLLPNINTYSPSTEFFNKIMSWICSIDGKTCERNVFNIVDKTLYINSTMMSVILGHVPAGSSTLQFIHYGQLVESGRFCRYDYNGERNVALYGEWSPPDYDLSLITVPVSLYYSGNDWFSDPRDVDILKQHLPNVYDYYYVSDFSHLDFIYGAEAKSTIYDRILMQIDEFENVTLP